MRLLSQFFVSILLFSTSLAVANEQGDQYIIITSQIFQTKNNQHHSFSEKLNNAELTAEPKLATHFGKPATIEMGIEGQEMLTMVITPNDLGTHVSVDLKLGMADSHGKWQQTTTSAINKPVAESFLLTAELGSNTYIITINTEATATLPK